jgi:D-hexose-6-phosphate mutarotase
MFGVYPKPEKTHGVASNSAPCIPTQVETLLTGANIPTILPQPSMQNSPPAAWLQNKRITRSESPDGLPVFHLQGGFGSARFSPQGAHLMEFTPTGQPPLLFLSKQTALTPGKAVRGGVPVIFPWFGARAGHPESPMHGLVRTRPWEIVELAVPEEGPAKIMLRFESTAETLSLWPYAFALSLELTLGEDLAIRWETQNTGAETFVFEQALHPYFPVADVRSATVHGLHGFEFIDKTDGMRLKTDLAEAVSFAGETDRLYLDTPSILSLEDPASLSRIVFGKAGSQSSVVWNPGIAKAAALADLGDEEWREFVCVEQANANRNTVSLASGEVHVFEARYMRQSANHACAPIEQNFPASI